MTNRFCIYCNALLTVKEQTVTRHGVYYTKQCSSPDCGEDDPNVYPVHEDGWRAIDWYKYRKLNGDHFDG